jgi:FMN phosphatase YigB (HAD superfamily)
LGSIPDLRKFLRERADRYTVISFDVFDTLLYRRIAPPERVRVPAARRYCEIAARHGIETDAQRAEAARSAIEGRLRSESFRAGMDAECAQGAVFTHWLRQLLADAFEPDQVDELRQVELAVERDTVYIPDGMNALLSDCVRRGMRLVCISDMYYDSSTVRWLLSHAGCQDVWERVFVSSEVGRTKGSGNLFRHALTMLQVAPNVVLHVGDNPAADYHQAIRTGVDSVLLRTGYHERNSRAATIQGVGEPHFGWDEALLQACRGYYEARSARSKGITYDIGYWLQGPLLVDFIYKTLLRILSAERCDAVIFPAREGFVLQQIYDGINATLFASRGPRSRYLYVSRKALFHGSVEEVDDSILQRITGGSRRAGLRDLARFTEMPLRDALAALCPLIREGPELWLGRRQDFTTLQGFRRHPGFRKMVEKRRYLAWEAAIGYLESELALADGQRYAFVDVGWNGTIQGALHRILRRRYAVHIDGYYMALTGQMSVGDDDRRDHYVGTYFDFRSGATSSPLTRFAQLFEFPCSAPHGTTVGYRYVGGRFEPLLVSDDSPRRQQEIRDNGYRAGFQAGIFDYLEDFMEVAPYFRHEELAAKPRALLDTLERLVRFPARRVADALLDFTQVEDFGNETILSRPPRGKHPRASKLAYMLWKEAYFSRWPLINPLYNLYRAARCRIY